MVHSYKSMTYIYFFIKKTEETFYLSEINKQQHEYSYHLKESKRIILKAPERVAAKLTELLVMSPHR